MTNAARRRRAIALTAVLAALSPATSAKNGGAPPDHSQAAEHARPGTPPTLAAEPSAPMAQGPPPAAAAPPETSSAPLQAQASAVDPPPAVARAPEPDPAPVAEPAPSPPPAAEPAPAPLPTAGISDAPPRVTRPVRGIAAPVSALRPAPAPVAPAVVRRAPPAAGIARRPAARPEEPAAAAPERRVTAPRTITSTITGVLELVPGGVWLAIGLLVAVGLVLAVATAVQTVRRRRLDRVRRALIADVGVLQSALLPELPEQIGRVRVTAAYRPAEGLAAGGDFFDAFEIAGGRTAVVVGDVTGHGREVVPLTAAVRYSLRAYLEAGLAPRTVLHVAGNALAGQLDSRQVTVVVAIHDPATSRLTYACAGHWPPLLLGVPGAAVTACSSPPLGAGLPTGRRQTTVFLPPGGAACFFTDGLTDVVVPGGRLGLAGLRDIVEDLGPDPCAQGLVARVVAASESQPDDMAACVLLPRDAEPGAEPQRFDELEVDAEDLESGRVERFLQACGADAAATARGLEQAACVAGLAGFAMLEVRTGAAGVSVWVAEPANAVLSLAGTGGAANVRAA